MFSEEPLLSDQSVRFFSLILSIGSLTTVRLIVTEQLAGDVFMLISDRSLYYTLKLSTTVPDFDLEITV